MKHIVKIFTLFFLFSGITSIANAQNTRQAIDQLKSQTEARVTIDHNNYGITKFVKFPVEKPLILEGNSLKKKVNKFLENYKAIYNISSIEGSLEFEAIKTDNYGLKSLILKQVHNGVPVFDGALRFHFNNSDKLTAINGNFIPNIKTNTTPTLTQTNAISIAFNAIDNQNLNQSGKELTIVSNTLYIFQKGLVQGYNGGNHLVYEIEITNEVDVRESLYIDAHDGSIVEQFTGMHSALDRVLYEGSTSDQRWTEGQGFPGFLDVWQRNEVAAAGHMWYLFDNTFKRDSYDGAGAQMVTINNLSSPGFCPNARWTGAQAQYCTGSASDDVVAHEWGHAYTGRTSNLIYAYQSGGLNESYSDVWGETVDLLNNYEDAGEDNSIRTGTSCSESNRWKIGEDATAFGGAIRDMWNPTCFGNPGKLSDLQYNCSASDNGGVHGNSGIPNHAYALLVDGGTYNGQTISGIGFTKAAHIWWKANNTYLTPTSDFSVFADALDAACADLIGINLEGLSMTATPAGPSGEIISLADCDEVAKAILAVELRGVLDQTTCGFNPILAPVADLCVASTTNRLFYEDWESGIGSWTIEQLPGNALTWDSRDWALTSSLAELRPGTGIFAENLINGDVTDCSLDPQQGIVNLQSPIIVIPNIVTGTFDLSINHYIASENGYDGGNIKYSLDGGAWTLIPGSSFTTNPYNRTFEPAPGNNNPSAGEEAFSGGAGGWGQSTINLSSLGVVANSSLQLRFEFSCDGCNGSGYGWYLDEIVIYNCTAALSVDEFNGMIDGVSIYPNPTSGIITLQRTTQVNLKTIKIYDVNGRILKNIDVSGMQLQKTIDINELATGIYFISVTSDDAKGVMRLIKE